MYRAQPNSFSWKEFLLRIGLYDEVSESADDTINVANKSIINWGLGIIAAFAIAWILPTSYLLFVRPILAVNVVVWCVVANKYIKFRWPITFPIIALLIIQFWSIFTAINASLVLGRPIGTGRSDFYIMEHMLPFFVAAGLMRLDPRTRNKMLLMVLVAFTLSSFVGWLQFFKFPPAIALSRIYTFKDIDFWDFKAGLRACGLSQHPAILAAQALICMAIVASRVYLHKVRTVDIVWLFFFSGTVIFTQARAVYIALAVIWAVIIVVLFRQNAKVATAICLVGGVFMVIGLMFAGNRLGYAMQSTSLKTDDSYLFRSENIWVQMDVIVKEMPITGIGPSPGLLLGTGPEDKWVPVGRVMESAYRLFLAMYGYTGLLLLIFLLIGSLASGIKALVDRGQSKECKRVVAMGIAYVLFLAINGYTANTFDGYVLIPVGCLLSALAAGTDLKGRHRHELSKYARYRVDWDAPKSLP